MPKILVTNDDGVHSEGIHALAAALRPLGQVIVAAPHIEASAIGHALTLRRPLRLERLRDGVYEIDGTPTDCVNIGITKLFQSLPDLVVSGINKGYNLGDDVTYSGTVSAAMEGTLLGVPSMAVSQVEGEVAGFEAAGRVAQLVAARLLVEGLPAKTLLNVNVPRGEVSGIRITRLGHRVYREKVIQEVDPRGRPYYWIGVGPPEWREDEASDIAAVHAGLASVTPLHLDLTHFGALGRMAEWEGGLNALLKKRQR